MKVRALALGYYGDARRRPGDVFTLTNSSHFAPGWMQVVSESEPEPERMTTAQQALDARLADLSPFGGVRRRLPPANEGGHAPHDFDPFASEEDA